MPLNGYDVNPEGCANVLDRIEDDPDRAVAAATLRDGLDAAQLACRAGTGIVGRALAELWQETISRQLSAAENRVLRAVDGVREAVCIISGADQEMAESAKARLAGIQAVTVRELKVQVPADVH